MEDNKELIVWLKVSYKKLLDLGFESEDLGGLTLYSYAISEDEKIVVYSNTKKVSCIRRIGDRDSILLGDDLLDAIRQVFEDEQFDIIDSDELTIRENSSSAVISEDMYATISSKYYICGNVGDKLYDGTIVVSNVPITLEKYNDTFILKGTFGLVNTQGEIIITPQFDTITYDKADNLFIVTKNNLKGVIDTKGNVLYRPIYDNIEIVYRESTNYDLFNNKSNNKDLHALVLMGDTYKFIDSKESEKYIFDIPIKECVGIIFRCNTLAISYIDEDKHEYGYLINIETKEKHLVYNSIRNILNDNYYLSNYGTRKYVICDMEGNPVNEWVFLGLFPFKTKGEDGTYSFKAELLDKDCVRHIRLDDSMNVLEDDDYE
jgi:hypothetical protein